MADAGAGASAELAVDTGAGVQALSAEASSNTLGQQLLVALERADAERGNRADDALSRALTEVSLARQQQPNGALPAALVERVKQRVAAADAAATDAHARQATISSAVYALRQVGDDAGAEALLLAELKRSEQPLEWWFKRRGLLGLRAVR